MPRLSISLQSYFRCVVAACVVSCNYWRHCAILVVEAWVGSVPLRVVNGLKHDLRLARAGTARWPRTADVMPDHGNGEIGRPGFRGERSKLFREGMTLRGLHCCCSSSRGIGESCPRRRGWHAVERDPD